MQAILVLSGKGGVGKSTVAANLAVALATKDKKVGLLDIDIHGPSIPTLLNLHKISLIKRGGRILPVISNNLKVMSVGFLLENEADPVIWRGPMKIKMIQQFVNEVEWGELDYLVVDSPPGTGDEPLSVCQLIQGSKSALIVTTPQKVAITDVKKSINFCKKLKVPFLGIVENMKGFVCPHCKEQTNIFQTGGGEALSRDFDVPFLGGIPLDPTIGISGDRGMPFVQDNPHSPTAKAFIEIVSKITLALDKNAPAPNGPVRNTFVFDPNDKKQQ